MLTGGFKCKNGSCQLSYLGRQNYAFLELDFLQKDLFEIFLNSTKFLRPFISLRKIKVVAMLESFLAATATFKKTERVVNVVVVVANVVVVVANVVVLSRPCFKTDGGATTKNPESS